LPRQPGATPAARFLVWQIFLQDLSSRICYQKSNFLVDIDMFQLPRQPEATPAAKYLVWQIFLQDMPDLSKARYVARFSLADIDIFVAKYAQCVARYSVI